MYDDLQRINLDNIKNQLDNCLFLAFKNIKKNKDVDYQTFESYFTKLYEEIGLQENNQSKIKKVITEIFNVM